MAKASDLIRPPLSPRKPWLIGVGASDWGHGPLDQNRTRAVLDNLSFLLTFFRKFRPKCPGSLRELRIEDSRSARSQVGRLENLRCMVVARVSPQGRDTRSLPASSPRGFPQALRPSRVRHAPRRPAAQPLQTQPSRRRVWPRRLLHSIQCDGIVRGLVTRCNGGALVARDHWPVEFLHDAARLVDLV